MEPSRDLRYTLVDLLDRVLDKGLVIYADIIVSVAGIPLIGVNLRAALAGMETMIKYGVMKEWDESTRAWEREHRRQKEPVFNEGEEVMLRVMGAHHYHKGIYIAWRYGYLYLTNQRLFLYSQDFGELLYSIRLDKIRGLGISKESHFKQRDVATSWDSLLAARRDISQDREILYLLLEGDEWARLRVQDVPQLKEAIEQAVTSLGITLEQNLAIPEFFDEKAINFLADGEKIKYGGKAWYQVEASGIIGDTWRPGYLYLTNQRLCWWNDFEAKLTFEIPLYEIEAATTSVRDLSGMLKRKAMLDIVYHNEQGKRVASFSGYGLSQWRGVLDEVIARESKAIEQSEIETCPQCGREAPASELLERGCSKCGWVSPRLKKELTQAESIAAK